MDMYGRELTREELLRRCNPSALYGARRMTASDGRGSGEKLIMVKTAGGLSAVLSESKCLDITELSYKGVNLGFLSKNGHVLTNAASPETDSFTRYWAGGFLSTCGLRNTGGACVANGENFAFHGHIGTTPAERVNITETEQEIVISGRIRESALFGHNLELERTVTIPVNGSVIKIDDTVHNMTPEPEVILLLYHINFGFPFLNEGLRLEFPKGSVRPRNAYAEECVSGYATVTAPADNAQEQVYFHIADEKEARVNLINNALNVKASICYDSTRLPVLAQWRCMRSGDYALGIEPGTSFIRGREQELKEGYDIRVPAFGSLKFGFTAVIGEA